MTDAIRLTAGDVSEIVDQLRDLAFRAQEHDDGVLFMVLYTAADSIANGLELHLDMQADHDV